MSYDPDDMSQARVITALNILTGNIKLPSQTKATLLDEEELAVVKTFHEVREKGYGEMRLTVIANHLDTVYTTQVRKRKDFLTPA